MATARKNPPRTSVASARAPAGRSLADAFAPTGNAAAKPVAKSAKAAGKTAQKTEGKKPAATASKAAALAQGAPAKVTPGKSAVSQASAQAAAPSKAAADTATREAKTRKPKLVRDSFTIPKTEYAVIDELKARSAKLGQPAKKSEVLRAGIKLLAGLTDAGLLAALGQVPALKTGRPGKA